MGIGKALLIGLGAYLLFPDLFKGEVTAGNIFQFPSPEATPGTGGIVSESPGSAVYEAPGITPYLPYYTERNMTRQGVPLEVQNSIGLILGEILSGLSPRDLTEQQLAMLVQGGLIQPAAPGVMQGVLNIPGYVPGGRGTTPTILMH